MKKSLSTPLIIIIILGTILLTSITFVGCSSFPKKVKVDPIEEVEDLKTEPISYTKPEIRLSPGDMLDIRFFYTPELNTIQTIRPDGKIALQLVGEITAQGKTPEALREELFSLYSKHLAQLDVTVIIVEYSNRRVYVGGQVLTPGSVPMPGEMTVFEALILAGGVNLEVARYDGVLVIRNVNGKWVGGKLDFAQVMQGEESTPYYLQPLDIVYVPETRIYAVNRWVEQHISRVVPEVGFGLTYEGGERVGSTVGVTLSPRESTR